MTQEVHIELLLGRRVLDVDGRPAGRIMAIRARQEGAHCFVVEYHLGAAALMRRLGITSARLIGLRSRPMASVVPWDAMDLSDPHRPRLNIRRDQLKEVEEQQREEAPPRQEPPKR